MSNWHETFARLGTWERVQRALAEQVRVADGRDPAPSLFRLDSPTVKSAETAADTGFDGGKKLKGHVLVDSLGLVFAVAVTSAGVSDAGGAEVVRRAAAEGNRQLATVLADGAYHRETLTESMTASGARYRLVIVSKLAGQTGFIPQHKRWQVEWYFSWLRGSRLLAREYEGREWISRSNVYMRSMMLTLKMYQRQQAKLASACAA